MVLGNSVNHERPNDSTVNDNSVDDYSVNETASRARLAAKGVGYSWGLADEVSFSVVWLSQRQVPAMALLAGLLSHIKTPQDVQAATPQTIGGALISNNDWLCPIISGCALSDWYQSLNVQEPLMVQRIRYPFLFVPFVAQLAKRSGKALVVEFGAQTIATDGDNVLCPDEKLLRAEFADLLICRVAKANELDFTNPELVNCANRVSVEKRHWQTLDEYAKKTYAPATESSRLSGAGAGVTDND